MKRSRHLRARRTSTKLVTMFLVTSLIAVAFAVGLLPDLGIHKVSASPGEGRVNMAELLDLLLHPKAFTALTVTYPPDQLEVIVPSDETDARLTVVAESDDPADTTNVGFGVDGSFSGSSYVGSLFGPDEALNEQNLAFEEPYFTTVLLSTLETLVGTHEMYAMGNVASLLKAGQYQYEVISEPVYFNVTEEPAAADSDNDGIPDDPFNVVGPGAIWIATGVNGREVIVANLDPGLLTKAVSPIGTGVPVLMSNLTVEAPTTQALVDEGLVEADSEVLLILAGDDDLEGLLGDTDWATAMEDSLPASLVPLVTPSDLALKQYFEISIIYTINGGTEYRELEQLTPDVPVLVTMDSLQNSANGKAAAFWSFDTEIRDEVVDAVDVTVIGEVDGAAWAKAQDYQLVADNRMTAELSSLSVFAPLLGRIDVTAIAPDAGPNDEDTSALITGTFLIDGTLALAEAEANYEVRFGSFVAQFDDSSGPVVTPTSIRVIVPQRPDLVVDTSVDVTVTEVGDALHADTLEDAFTYEVVPPPTIASLSPNAGPIAGGTAVTILGTSLAEASAVTFDGVAGTNLVVVSDTEITITTPAHAAGAVDVAVTARGGTVTQSGGFTFVAAPQVLFVDPIEGPVTGGTEVTITGQNFSSLGLQVAFGDIVAPVISQTETKIVVTSPEQTAGTVDVTVTTAGGTATLANAFTYLPVGLAPTIATITPAQGPATGGTTVTITGANFESLQVVAFGGVPASITSASPTQLVVVTQPHSPNVVDVIVRTLNGTATKSSAYLYTPVGGIPTITSIEPEFGPTGGGTNVVVRGTNLSTAQSVAFGSAVVTDITIVSSTRIDLLTPAHNAGAVDVIVTTAGGEATLEGGFTFRDPRVNVFSVEPDKAWAFGGVVARIEGQGFTSEAAGDPVVTFGGVQAEVVDASDDELLVIVPPQMLPDGTPAQTEVDIVVAKTVDGAVVNGTRQDAFIYQHFVKRNETFGNQTDSVMTTAFFLEDGAGSHEIVNGTLPSIAKGRFQAPAGLGLGDVGVLVRSSKSPAVFGLTNLSTGLVIPNVWYYDVHFYSMDGVEVDPESADAGELAYEELGDLEFERGAPTPVLIFPVTDTDLTSAELDEGRVALYGLDTELMSQPVGAPIYALQSNVGEYQSQPLADEIVFDDADEPATIMSRIYQPGAFGLRNDVVPDLDALNLRLDEIEHPDGVVEGPPSGGTRVVLVSDGGLGWVDRVTFVVGGFEVEADILTEPASNEFLLVVESPVVVSPGTADIRVYLLADPHDAAGTLEDAFVYTGSLGPCFIATAAYGTPMADEVNVLRTFRDAYLLNSALGTAFVDTYYRVSPGIAEVVAAHPALAAVVRAMLVPVIAVARMMLAAPYAVLAVLAGLTFVTVRRRVRKLAAR